MQHLQPNTTLQGGKYRIERVLGQGGFGIAYLAVQTSLNRKVAIKEFFMQQYCLRGKDMRTVLAPQTEGGKQVEQFKRKFHKEAENLAMLRHPNIIDVIDVFEENDTVYFSMPYLLGGSLQDYVNKHGALSEQKAMKYVRQIARALKYMHEKKRICHYDVKPANILLDDNDNAVLIDFGISKNYSANGTTSTPVGVSEGYAPIEQCDENFKGYSPTSDVYALGATLYFLLHGKRPVNALSRTQGTALLMNRNLSQGTKDIINSSMKIMKTERAQSMDVFMKEKVYQPHKLPEIPVHYSDNNDERTTIERKARREDFNTSYKYPNVTSTNDRIVGSNSSKSDNEKEYRSRASELREDFMKSYRKNITSPVLIIFCILGVILHYIIFVVVITNGRGEHGTGNVLGDIFLAIVGGGLFGLLFGAGVIKLFFNPQKAINEKILQWKRENPYNPICKYL